MNYSPGLTLPSAVKLQFYSWENVLFRLCHVQWLCNKLPEGIIPIDKLNIAFPSKVDEYEFYKVFLPMNSIHIIIAIAMKCPKKLM